MFCKNWGTAKERSIVWWWQRNKPEKMRLGVAAMRRKQAFTPCNAQRDNV